MNESLTNLYLSGRLADAPIEGIAIYTFLRVDADSGRNPLTRELWQAQGKLASFASVQTIGQTFGVHEFRVNMLMTELFELGWIKPIDFERKVAYLLGQAGGRSVNYLVDCVPRKTTSANQTATELRQQVVERQERTREKAKASIKLREQTSDRLKRAKAEANPNKAAYWLARHFGDRYSVCFGHSFAGIGPKLDPKLFGPFKKIFEFADSSLTEGEKYIDFVLENWGALTPVFGLTDEPGPFLIAHPGFFQRVKNAMRNGIPTQGSGLGDRTQGTDWENAKSGWD